MYEIYGPLFFGSVSGFLEKFEVEDDPFDIIIDFVESRVADMSAIDALNKITAKYAQVNKRVTLKHLSRDCRDKLEKAQGVITVTMER